MPRLLLAGALLFATSSMAHATKLPAPPRDLASLAGVWVGPMEATSHPWARLEIDKAGRGTLVLSGSLDATHVATYRVTATKISGFHATFITSPINTNDSKISLNGDIELNGLRLVLTQIGSNASKQRVFKMTLEPKDHVTNSLNILENASEELRASGDQ